MRIGVLIVAAGLLSGCADRAEEDTPGPRNLVLLVIDTLRADRLGCYGYPRDTSPSLDALAARGLRAERCYAQGTWTGPSMISMMTGLYVTDEEERLPTDRKVLAEYARDAGLQTAAFIGNRVLAHDRGYPRGFDHFEATRGPGKAAGVFPRFRRWFAKNRARREQQRFFTWLHVTDPHTPYEPAPTHDRFGGDEPPGAADLRARWRDLAPPFAFTPAAKTVIDEDEAARRMLEVTNLYDGEVVGVDAAVGELLAFLELEGELDRTLFIVASDHGEALYAHHMYAEDLRVWIRQTPSKMGDGAMDRFEKAHGSCFHDEVWRVPLILAGPGVPRGAVREGLTANLDLLPTVLGALGIEAPRDLPGEDLLSGAPSDRRRVFGYSRRAAAVVSTDGWKFVDRRRKRELYPEWARADGDPTRELIDRNADPAELTNVIDEKPDIAQAFERIIDQWFSAHTRVVDRRVSDRDLEALRQMGYLGDGD